MLASLPPDKSLITTQRKHVCHCAAKTLRGIVFPGHDPQVIVEQLQEVMEEIKKEKRESDRNQVKQVNCRE